MHQMQRTGTALFLVLALHVCSHGTHALNEQAWDPSTPKDMPVELGMCRVPATHLVQWHHSSRSHPQRKPISQTTCPPCHQHTWCLLNFTHTGAPTGTCPCMCNTRCTTQPQQPEQRFVQKHSSAWIACTQIPHTTTFPFSTTPVPHPSNTVSTLNPCMNAFPHFSPVPTCSPPCSWFEWTVRTRASCATSFRCLDTQP